MNIKKTLVQFTAASALLFSASYVSAGIVVNTNTITDTTSNLEWLFLSETSGVSYNYIEAETESGGAMENYRFATYAEVITLLENNNAGVPGIGPYSNAFANLASWSAGVDITNNGSAWFGIESAETIDADGFQFTNTDNYVFYNQFAAKAGGALQTNGYALVVDGESSVAASVSTPLAAFGAIGLMGFMGLSRKKKLISK